MSSVLKPDPQYVNTIQSDPIPPGITKLCRALLIISILDTWGYGGKREKTRALEWFSSDDTSYIFSFLNVCSLLHIDPRIIRQGIRAGQVV